MGTSWSNVGFGSTERFAMNSARAHVLAQGYKITHSAMTHHLKSRTDPGAPTTKYFVRVSGYGWYHMQFTEHHGATACSLVWIAYDLGKTHKIERYKVAKNN